MQAHQRISRRFPDVGSHRSSDLRSAFCFFTLPMYKKPRVGDIDDWFPIDCVPSQSDTEPAIQSGESPARSPEYAAASLLQPRLLLLNHPTPKGLSIAHPSLL